MRAIRATLPPLLVVLALLAALIGPGFVDWRGYRPHFEARLAETLGVETRIGGGIARHCQRFSRIIPQRSDHHIA